MNTSISHGEGTVGRVWVGKMVGLWEWMGGDMESEEDGGYYHPLGPVLSILDCGYVPMGKSQPSHCGLLGYLLSSQYIEAF